MTVTEQRPATAEAAPAIAPPEPTAGALRPANLVAERERARLLRRGGRTGAAAALAGLVHGARWLGGAEAAESGRRYVPAAWTVIAVAAVALHLPGDVPARTGSSEFAASVPVAPVASPTGATTPAAAGPSAPSGGVAVRPAAPIAAAPGRGSGVVPADRPAAPAPVASTGGPPPSVAPTPTAGDVALRLRDHAWASHLGEVGTAVTPVPEGTLPVAARMGQPEKVSYLRLGGEGTELSLVEDPVGADEAFGEGVVRLCAVEDDGWKAGPGQRLADMPAWSDDCAEGVRDGARWTFDLAGLGDPASDSGWALVPGDDVVPSFQLTFRTD